MLPDDTMACDELPDHTLLERLHDGRLDQRTHRHLRHEACRRGLLDEGRCDEDLLDGESDDEPMDELVPLPQRFAPGEARNVHARLRAADIDAVITDAHAAPRHALGHAVGHPLAHYTMHGARVLVPASQTDTALRVISGFVSARATAPRLMSEAEADA